MSMAFNATRPRLLAAVGATMLVCMALLVTGNARAADPAIFDVGAGTASINPDTPQYIGGYGYKAGPTTDVHDPLEIRAFVVGKGDQAAAFLVADLTGWFAAYRGANLVKYGIDATRERIAAKLAAKGYAATRGSVIISSTHTHAAPAVVGIWGTIDADYLKKVSEAAEAAVDQAIASLEPSEIWTAVGNVKSFVWQNGQGTNHPDGFDVDEDLPIMWAREPGTGATNALYANVPNHPDQFRGENYNQFSADWVGYARKKLDDLNGGTAVIGPGTLGRQEPPGSNPAYEEVIPQGEYVANEIQRTMAKAVPLTDDTIASTEAYLQFEADNDDLILGMNLYNPPAGDCIDLADICTIPRATVPPYLTAGTNPGDNPLIGTYSPSIRIGDVLYSTNPGEAFPEVNDAIRDSVQGVRHANVVGMANDMLGYYYVRDDYTSQQFGSSNFPRYNVGPDFPQLNADKSRANAATLGFQTSPKVVKAIYDTDIADRPGLQFYSDRLESVNPTFSFYTGAKRSQDTTVTVDGPVRWDFGDGTTGTSVDNDRFEHTFPGPGTYEVKAEVTGSNGKTRNWSDTIVVTPQLNVTAAQKSRAWNAANLEVTGNGGSGKLVAARWTCQDGTKLEGLKVSCAGAKAGEATVTAVDGAGTEATASVKVTKAPPKPAAKLRIVQVKPKTRTIKRGRSGVVRVKVKNVGKAAAKKAKVCVKAARGVRGRPACRSLGNIAAGKAKTTRLKLKTTGRARARAKLKITARAAKTKAASARVAVRAR